MSTERVDREVAAALRVLRRAVAQGQIARKRARVVPAGPNMVARLTTGALLGEVARRGFEVGEPHREMYAREFERRHLPHTALDVRRQEEDHLERDHGRAREVDSAVGVAVGAAVLAGVMEERISDAGLADQVRWDVVEADVENFLEETPGGDDVLDEIHAAPVTMGELAQDFAFLGLNADAVEAAQFSDQFDQMPLPDALAAQRDTGSGGALTDLTQSLNEAFGSALNDVEGNTL